jgi:hypothetical protein
LDLYQRYIYGNYQTCNKDQNYDEAGFGLLGSIHATWPAPLLGDIFIKYLSQT